MINASIMKDRDERGPGGSMRVEEFASRTVSQAPCPARGSQPARSTLRGARIAPDGQEGAGEDRAPSGYGRVSGERTEAVVEESVRKMSEKALGMLKHMRRQIFGHPAPYVEVRGAAVSIGVNPGGSECDGLVDELLQAGYIQIYPSPSLTAHGLYRLTDQGIAAAREAAPEEG